MNKKVYNIGFEPKGHLYYELIDFIKVFCDKFLLVERQTISFDLTAKNIIRDLNDYIVEEIKSNQWPGTILLNEEAWVRTYKLNSETEKIIKQATNRLFEWKQPRLLEDLCFLRFDGTSLLTSISHEEDAFFELFDNEKIVLFEKFPKLFE